MKIRGLWLAALFCGCAGTNSRILVSDPLQAESGLFKSGEYEKVILLLNRPAIQKLHRTSQARAYALLGQSYARAGKPDQALGVFQFAEGLFPKDIDILSGMADLLHSIDLDDRASPYYQRILSRHPNNASANRGLAEILAAQGLLPEACARYEKALKEQDNDPVVWRQYAEVLAERQDFKRAVEAVSRSLNLDRSADSLVDLALFQRRQGDSAQAYLGIEEARRLTPGRDDLKNREALWRLEDGETEKALALANEILARTPDNSLARWIRASVELRRGSLDAAEGDLALASAQHAQPFIARVSSAMLEELRGRLTRISP